MASQLSPHTQVPPNTQDKICHLVLKNSIDSMAVKIWTHSDKKLDEQTTKKFMYMYMCSWGSCSQNLVDVDMLPADGSYRARNSRTAGLSGSLTIRLAPLFTAPEGARELMGDPETNRNTPAPVANEGEEGAQHVLLGGDEGALGQHHDTGMPGEQQPQGQDEGVPGEQQNSTSHTT